MFTGHSICSLDAKSRIIIPAKFRKYIKPEAENKLILTRGMDQCLLVYPQDEWQKVTAGLTRYNQFNSDQRFFIRQFLNFVNECELDSQNRILIPPQLVQFAKLKKDIRAYLKSNGMTSWNPTI